MISYKLQLHTPASFLPPLEKATYIGFSDQAIPGIEMEKLS
jgi:hypothetical protein